MKQIEQLLRRTMGLDAASIGSSSIQRAVRARMKQLGQKTLADYLRLLQTSSEEWNGLVESVVVTETWFFRDAEPIAAFARHVAEEWLRAHPGQPARLLSLGCATGEEPYSLAMALREAGAASTRLEIEAVDISACALAHAERGIYGRNSFRGEDLAFRERYFRQTAEGFVLDPQVRGSVRFVRGNVLGEDLLLGHAAYDFIFCRNVLIYFDRPTQRQTIEKLAQLLAPGGMLFVGTVEVPLVREQGFVAAGIPGASAHRRAGQAARRPRAIRLSKRPLFSAALKIGGLAPQLLRAPRLPLAASRPRYEHTGRGTRLAGEAQPPPAAKTATPPVESELMMARRVADAGRLQEAAELCKRHLRQHKASAEAYYLLGLIRDAEGDPAAIDCYRRALYLQPDHYESLVQMALLLQKNGEPARARAFRNRAERVAGKPQRLQIGGLESRPGDEAPASPASGHNGD